MVARKKKREKTNKCTSNILTPKKLSFPTWESHAAQCWLQFVLSGLLLLEQATDALLGQWFSGRSDSTLR